MDVHKITASSLKLIMDSQTASKLLILDCRTFVAFNTERIDGAVHVFLPSILKRRIAVSGCLLLEKLLTAEIRRRLRNGDFTKVVLYDSNETIRDDSEITIIIQGLKMGSYNFKSVQILKGGFQAFKAKYPHYCIQQRPSTVMMSSEASNSSPNMHSSSTTNATKNAPTQLMPHLFIGDENHSTNYNLLRKLGITAILNVSNIICTNHVTQEFEYKCFPVRDNESENISTWFSDAIQFIESARLSDGKILVHCKAGISRSATICIAYLMSYKSLTLDQAFEYVRTRREIISPNMNFMQQLFEYERKLLVSRMRNFVFPSVNELSPLTCAQTTEKSPGIGTNVFSFNLCAVSQI